MTERSAHPSFYQVAFEFGFNATRAEKDAVAKKAKDALMSSDFRGFKKDLATLFPDYGFSKGELGGDSILVKALEIIALRNRFEFLRFQSAIGAMQKGQLDQFKYQQERRMGDPNWSPSLAKLASFLI